MKKKLTAGLSLLLVCAMLAVTAGCGTTVQAKDLMQGVTPGEVIAPAVLTEQNEAVTDFAVRLFQACAGTEEDGNVLISPLSALYALSMTANGAAGETLEQMEKVLGMSVEKLNETLYSYRQEQEKSKEKQLHLANSIWFTDQSAFEVNRDFLQANADYYGAELYRVPFQPQTLREINQWVKKNTDGRIPEILDQISPEAVMYLINALAFEAEWMQTYEKESVVPGKFHREDGTKQDASLMYGRESLYLKDEKAQGFIKPYQNGRFAFAALLPEEGISLSEYCAALDGKALHTLLANPQRVPVETAIPKFETEYSVEMAGILAKMGMERAFDRVRAEFDRLGTLEGNNIHISRVLQKTFISVGEKGTEAGASTVVEMRCGSCLEEPSAVRTVYLDRPFVYMLIDCENLIPFFIGTVTGLENE